MFGEPGLASSAQYLADLTHYLAARGWIVEVLCSNRLYEDPAGRLPARARYGGVTVRRLPVRLFERSGLLRLLGYIQFLVRAFFWALFARRPAVCVSTTTTPFLLGVGAVVRLRGARHLHWSLDIYPEVARALGAIGGRTASMLARVRGVLWRMTDLVVTLGPCMRDSLRRAGLPHRKLRVVPLWAKACEFTDEVAARPLPKERFMLLYSGNIGRAHDVDTALAAARRLPEVDFVFAGGGAKGRRVKEAAREVPNISLRPLVPRERVAEHLSGASAHLVTLEAAADGLLIPCKIYGAMASGRPVVLVASGRNELAAELDGGGFGFRVEPGDVDGFVRAVRRLVRDPELASEMGARAREAFLERYEASACMRDFHEAARRLVTAGE